MQKHDLCSGVLFLTQTVEELLRAVLPKGCSFRIRPDAFPFTNPSFEADVRKCIDKASTAPTIYLCSSGRDAVSVVCVFKGA